MKISALIHTKNSEKTVEQALVSVNWADEIVVVDMHSSDRTVEICRKYTDRIYSFDDVGYVEPARNYGIEKTTGDWVIILDADEEIQEKLASRLRKLADEDPDVWMLPRKNILFGHWIKSAGWWPDYNLRFFRKGHVTWPETLHAQPKYTGKLARLEADESLAIRHHNYPTVSEFIDRMNRYTSIAVSEKGNAAESALRAFWQEFQSRFMAKEGYIDGAAGLHASLLQSFYEAVVRIKQWEAKKAPSMPLNVADELSWMLNQISYWRADYMIKHTKGIRRVYWKIRRKLRR